MRPSAAQISINVDGADVANVAAVADDEEMMCLFYHYRVVVIVVEAFVIVIVRVFVVVVVVAAVICCACRRTINGVANIGVDDRLANTASHHMASLYQPHLRCKYWAISSSLCRGRLMSMNEAIISYKYAHLFSVLLCLQITTN